MNKILRIKWFLLIAIMVAFTSCYEDKGNYDYKELTSLTIDTVNSGIKPEMTAIQFERFRVPVTIKYAGDKKDLAYEWKIYPQNPQKPDDVSKYDSAVVLSYQEVFDTVIYEVPGKYKLTLMVTNHTNDTKEYLTIKLNVESALSRGLCVMDEKNGVYDLNMIKTAKLQTDLTVADEQIYYQVFSRVNERTVTNGKFLGWFLGYTSSPALLYFFTEDGGFTLNSNSFAIVSDDYKGLFSFPITISGVPQAFMVTSRPMEMIVDKGLVYAFDHRSTSNITFGDQLQGDYYAAPYLPRISTSTFATVIYDTKNGRFAPIGQFGTNVGEFPDNAGGEFDLNHIGMDMELKYMDNGFNAYTYSVFKNKTTSGYALYVADFSGKEALAVKKYDMSGCSDLNDNCLYAFAATGNICFYASGSNLYQYKYSSTNASVPLHSFAGETITGLKVFKMDGEAADGKWLMVSTYTSSGEGKVYLIEFNQLNGELGEIPAGYGGFGRIVDFMYKK